MPDQLETIEIKTNSLRENLMLIGIQPFLWYKIFNVEHSEIYAMRQIKVKPLQLQKSLL